MQNNILVCNQPQRPTQPGHPSVGGRNEYQQKLGPKQAHVAIHYNPVSVSGSVNWRLAEGEKKRRSAPRRSMGLNVAREGLFLQS